MASSPERSFSQARRIKLATVLITGAAGYIGSHFLRRLLHKGGVKIVAVDNLTEGHREALPSDSRITFSETDIADLDKMTRLLQDHKVDAVVHFAANAYVGESQEKPFKYFDNNVIGTLNLFKAMDAVGVSKIVFSSSCATYGNPSSYPIDEDHSQNPVSVYGMTKLIVEKALRALAGSKGWSYASLRYFNAAGADDSGDIGESHDPETHLIPLALQTALGKRDCLNVYGEDYQTPDGTCIRDYVHVNDLADAHIQALEKLGDNAEIIVNLGSSVGASVKEVVRMCEEVSGKKIALKSCPRRFGDAVELAADYKRAREVLGWQPQYDLRRIVETAWRWESNRRF